MIALLWVAAVWGAVVLCAVELPRRRARRQVTAAPYPRRRRVYWDRERRLHMWAARGHQFRSMAAQLERRDPVRLYRGEAIVPPPTVLADDRRRHLLAEVLASRGADACEGCTPGRACRYCAGELAARELAEDRPAYPPVGTDDPGRDGLWDTSTPAGRDDSWDLIGGGGPWTWRHRDGSECRHRILCARRAWPRADPPGRIRPGTGGIRTGQEDIWMDTETAGPSWPWLRRRGTGRTDTTYHTGRGAAGDLTTRGGGGGTGSGNLGAACPHVSAEPIDTVDGERVGWMCVECREVLQRNETHLT